MKVRHGLTPSHPRDLPARAAQVCDEADLYGVGTGFEDDRNGRICRFCRERSRSAGCGNHSHPALNQISYQRWQPIMLALRPAVFDRDVLTIDIPGFAQPFENCRG